MKKKIDLPKRSDNIYLEIENFQDYELTNCIAYEMAIRNDEALDKVKSFEMFIFDNYEDSYNELKNKYYFNRDIIFNLKYHKNELRGIKTLGDIKHGVKDLFLFLQSKNLLMKFDEEETSIEKNVNDLTIDEIIKYKEFLCFYGYKNNKRYTCGIFDELDLELVPKEFIKLKIDDFNKETTLINISFSRHKLSIPTKFDKTINLKINPNLPKDELMAYISKIKDEYDKDNSIIKSPLELLGEKLNIKTIKFKEMTSKEWADCFFIYDYFKVSTDKLKGTKIQKLQELLTEYNGIKIEKTKEELRKSKNRNDNSKYKIVSFKVYNELRDNYVHKKIKPFYSLATIEDRLKLMTLLIDDLGYKTLIL